MADGGNDSAGGTGSVGDLARASKTSDPGVQGQENKFVKQAMKTIGHNNMVHMKQGQSGNGRMIGQGGDGAADLANGDFLDGSPDQGDAASNKIAATDTPFADPDLVDEWEEIKAELKSHLGDATWDSWIKPLRLITLDGGRLILGAPSRFMRDWVMARYPDLMVQLWQPRNPHVMKIDIRVTARKADGKAAAAKTDARPVTSPAVHLSKQQTPASGKEAGFTSLGAPLDERFQFDNFIVGKSNELAHAAARRVAEQERVQFNPLFLYGGVGLGKTHLMHAIAHEIQRRDPSRKVLYLSAEKFMYQFIRALRFKDTMAFKQQFRSVDVLMVDDVQFISGKESTQEEFFHTFNALVDHNRQVIISADRSPSDLDGIEERIRSRLGWGLVADIHPTDYELRLGILQTKADLQARTHPNVDIPSTILEFLAHRITSNVRELEGALNRVVAFADLVGRPISMEMVQDVLQDLLRANDRRVTIDEIQRKVAEYFNVRLNEMLSARRARAIARPRQVAMYLAKQLTSRSLPEIGRKFGGRDHTTVMHAVKKVEELCADDPQMANDVETLRRILAN